MPQAIDEFAHGVLAQILGHHICWVVGTGDLSVLEVLPALSLLNPQGADVDTSELARSLALCKGKGSGRVRIDDATRFNAKVPQHAAHSQQFS